MQETLEFASEPQVSLTFGEPLTERYRPQHMTDFVGLEKPKAILAGLLRKPRPCSLIFVGPPGSGKSTMAMAFANELGAGFIHLPSQSLTKESVETTWERVHYYPGTRSTYWVVLADEADYGSLAFRVSLLSKLDSAASFRPVFGGGMTPGKAPEVIWIFTANGDGQSQTGVTSIFEPRFISRSLVIQFEPPTREKLGAYLRQVWMSETESDGDSMDFEQLAVDSNLAVRDALQKLELELLSADLPQAVAEQIEIVSPEPIRAKTGILLRAIDYVESLYYTKHLLTQSDMQEAVSILEGCLTH